MRTDGNWQLRTPQWLQGKTLDRSTPLGPWLVTQDEFGAGTGRMRCEVDGELMQEADASDLVSGPALLIAYIATIMTQEPAT